MGGIGIASALNGRFELVNRRMKACQNTLEGGG